MGSNIVGGEVTDRYTLGLDSNAPSEGWGAEDKFGMLVPYSYGQYTQENSAEVKDLNVKSINDALSYYWEQKGL